MKRVFVVGCPRSGTTWSTLLLGQHPAVATCPQTRLFFALSHLEQWHRVNCSKLFSSFGVGFRAGRPDAAAGDAASAELLPKDELDRLLRAFGDAVFERILRSRTGASVVVEQTPEHVRLAELILRVFPDAYFLHVIRDPRSVFASMRSAVATWASADLFPLGGVERARFWCAMVQQGRGIAERTERYREARYEALTRDPAREVGAILQWLGLPADLETCARAAEACRIENLKGDGRAPAGFFRRGEMAGWKSELSGSEIGLVEYVCGDLMAELGYERFLPRREGKPLAVHGHELRGRASDALRRVRVALGTRPDRARD